MIVAAQVGALGSPRPSRHGWIEHGIRAIRQMTLTVKQQLKRFQRGHRHNNTGRSRRKQRFVKLDHWMLKGDAWRALTPQARALYVELAQRYNGSNNGEIALSVREAARALHIAKDTATRTFHELEAVGFIKRHVCGSFNWKLRHATTWVLTEFPLGDDPPTKEFARWRPINPKPGPNPGPTCPNSGTLAAKFSLWSLQDVLGLGPWAPFFTRSRSQMAARI